MKTIIELIITPRIPSTILPYGITYQLFCGLSPCHLGNSADEASGSDGFPGNADLFLAAVWACAGSAAGREFQEGAQFLVMLL